MSEWFKEHAWKACMRQRIEGSNPFLSAKPVTIVTGFFNATQRRKLAFESWGALKKPKSAGEFLIHQHSLIGFGKRARLGDAGAERQQSYNLG